VTNCAHLTVEWRIGRDWAETRGKAGCEAESSSCMVTGIAWHGTTEYRGSFTFRERQHSGLRRGDEGRTGFGNGAGFGLAGCWTSR
jgi:hypothetical protein